MALLGDSRGPERAVDRPDGAQRGAGDAGCSPRGVGPGHSMRLVFAGEQPVHYHSEDGGARDCLDRRPHEVLARVLRAVARPISFPCALPELLTRCAISRRFPARLSASRRRAPSRCARPTRVCGGAMTLPIPGCPRSRTPRRWCAFCTIVTTSCGPRTGHKRREVADTNYTDGASTSTAVGARPHRKILPRIMNHSAPYYVS